MAMVSGREPGRCASPGADEPSGTSNTSRDSARHRTALGGPSGRYLRLSRLTTYESASNLHGRGSTAVGARAAHEGSARRERGRRGPLGRGATLLDFQAARATRDGARTAAN